MRAGSGREVAVGVAQSHSFGEAEIGRRRPRRGNFGALLGLGSSEEVLELGSSAELLELGNSVGERSWGFAGSCSWFGLEEDGRASGG